jgi:23S rRNA pseudouridine955/2504/2580 synthase/23S rRNA pseudouridine1911/1915/1917 synthase
MQERTISTTAGPELEDVRLDHFLTGRFTYQSRTGWQSIIRAGRISVNGIRVRASRRLHAGDVVTFDVQGIAEPEVDPSYSVVLERPDFLVVSKSGCLPVHPSGCYFQNTLLMLMKEKYGELFVVNRLDRETSGLVVLAKDAETAGILSGLFASRQVEKKYLAAVFGAFPAGTIVKTGWLSSDPSSPVRKKRRFTETDPETEDAEPCCTEFTCLKTCNGFSLVECRPHTGRLHQIRATLCSCGFPLVGDKLYGPDDTVFLRFTEDAMTDADREALVLPTQALHAWQLRFTMPGTEERIRCESAPPDAMLELFGLDTDGFLAGHA